MICGIIKVEVSVISRAETLTETLIILHIPKTEFNNCFIIHLFVLNRYRLLIIAGSFADNSVHACMHGSGQPEKGTGTF